MRARYAPWALALLLAPAQPHAAAADAVSVTEVRVVDSAQLPAVQAASHGLRLTAHAFRDSRWRPQEIVAAVIDAGRLLAQCGIALAHAELRIIEAPRRLRYYYTPDSRRLLRAIDAPRPALFFVEDTKNDPAFDAEAIGLANAKTRPELANTIWIAYGARDLPYAIAHELVHLLSDSGEHSGEGGNLMGTETAPGSDKLTPAQCDRLRLRGEANGLLTSRSR